MAHQTHKAVKIYNGVYELKAHTEFLVSEVCMLLDMEIQVQHQEHFTIECVCVCEMYNVNSKAHLFE